MAGDDLRGKLLYLENRVALAKLLFPKQATVAMEIDHVDDTPEFTLETIYSQNLADAQRTAMDLNYAPFLFKEEHLVRLRALSKTVKLGKRFFPRCSEVLDRLVDPVAHQWKDIPEERQLKKQKYMEIKEIVNKAFYEDKEELDKNYNLSSSLSSTSALVKSPNRIPDKNLMDLDKVEALWTNITN